MRTGKPQVTEFYRFDSFVRAGRRPPSFCGHKSRGKQLVAPFDRDVARALTSSGEPFLGFFERRRAFLRSGIGR
jgi:hypothetical protein